MPDDITILDSPLNKTYEDKFYFLFNLPEALRNVKSEHNRRLQGAGITKDSIRFSLIDAEIPQIVVKAESEKYGGGGAYVSTHTIDPYDPLKISFKIDDKYTNYFVIYEWLNFIRNENLGYFDPHKLAQSANLKAYATNMSVVTLDPYNHSVSQHIFHYAFPTSLSSIKLNYQNTGEIICNASFVYSQMYVKNYILDDIPDAMRTATNT